MEGTVDQDSGAAIRDGIKSVNVQGVCPEKTWPYNIKKFTVKPTPAAYKSALLCQTLKYQRINQTLNDMCLCLFNGFPIVLGFTVYESFESDAVAQTGIAPMPQKSEKVLGGHAVCCVGYDLTAQTWICRNSWGTGWGMNGYFTLQQEYLLHPDLACDFWTITLTE
jgi:C1A family cysteine protease